MTSGIAIPQTPAQIAAYGHISIALRKFLTAKNWQPKDLCKALGLKPGQPHIYQWLSGKGAPGPVNRKKLAKVMGVPESELTRREHGKALVTMPALQAMPIARIKLPSEVLAFSVTSDGTATIKLNTTLALHLATPLLRMLLDAGLVFSKETDHDETKSA